MTTAAPAPPGESETELTRVSAAHDDRAAARVGLVYGVGAYVWWGLIAIYFKVVAEAGAVEVLAHRMVWSVPLLALLLTLRGRWGELRDALRSRTVWWALGASTTLIAANWLLFIWAVSNGRLSEASLGYFINPLVNVALGAVFLRERLRPAQLLCLALAAAGVVHQTLGAATFPWIALTLAGCFGFYGLVRKVAPIKPIPGLFCEVTILLPPAIAYMAWLGFSGGGHFLTGDVSLSVLLPLAGVITIVPLIWFTEAARRLRLSTLGFIQYIAPTGQLLLAVLAFGEVFTRAHAITFGLIWTALALYSFDSIRHAQRSRRALRGDELLKDL